MSLKTEVKSILASVLNRCGCQIAESSRLDTLGMTENHVLNMVNVIKNRYNHLIEETEYKKWVTVKIGRAHV